MTEDQLAKMASKFGKIISCQIKQTADKQSMGKALVTYENKEDACVAIQKLYFEDQLGSNVEIEFY